MIKLLIFDLDGVLADFKDIHFKTLNEALNEIDEKYVITEEEHLSFFDGLPTKSKLIKLTELKGLPMDFYNKIYDLKQDKTFEYIINNIKRDEKLIELFEYIKTEYPKVKIAVGSNSIRKTIELTLKHKEVINYFDLIVSNEDVDYSKPNPQMYLKVMSKYGISPKETLIIEDSPHGIEAVNNSCSNLMRVSNSTEVNKINVLNKINELNNMNIQNNKWDGKGKYNVLIPMAGAGSRFKEAGYTFPKPLIEVDGKPMIQKVVDNLNIDAHFIYVVQKEHYEQYNLKYLLELITPNCDIIQIDGVTEGAACTTLLAKHLINDDKHLIIANSDQFVVWDSQWFYYNVEEQKLDGALLSFTSTHPKWSYSKVDDKGFITEVAEKQVISDIATVGIYYYNKGSEYVKYAESMIEQNIRYKNEYYVCPVYNEFIKDGKKIKPFTIKEMWGLGTPEDLNYYNQNFKK